MSTGSYTHADQARRVSSRLVVEGALRLETPAMLGNGDADGLVDMALLVSPHDDVSPLLTGASLAGALRSYLERRAGPADSVSLFGGERGDDEGEQSPLIVSDSIGSLPPDSPPFELRDGVAIDPDSRTARDKALFDAQLWPADTVFPLRFELLLDGADDDGLKRRLATALHGLSTGDIGLGGRKSRGWGQITAFGWRARSYDLRTPDGLLDWVMNGQEALPNPAEEQCAAEALGVSVLADDLRSMLTIEAEFALRGSIMVRSSGSPADRGPDGVHMHGRRNGDDVQIIPGTSSGGALRARTLKIYRTLGLSRKDAASAVCDIFGSEQNARAQPRAGRIRVREAVLRNVRTDLVQTRNSIDRFTGGTLETALFSEQPAFGRDESRVSLRIDLGSPRDHEIGLLLLLLKDLWTGDLPLGGEASVGRGTLEGRSATITLNRDTKTTKWVMASSDGGLIFAEGDGTVLDDYVKTSLLDKVKEKANGSEDDSGQTGSRP